MQDLIVKSHNVLYRLAIWQTSEGKYLRGSLPQEIREQGHFGALLKTYILYQYYHCHVTQLYQELKNYKKLTAPELELQKARLESRFEEIFSQSTCFESRLPFEKILN